jgi:two-component system LytT family response regulator
MESFSCIIIEDESRARILLRTLIETYCLELDIAAEAANLPEGVQLIKEHKPDLVFLDVEMPGHTGLEIAQFIGPEDFNFEIIFTTAYQEYAIDAFRLSAIDYLLKPIDYEKLQEAVSKFIKKRKAEEYFQAQTLDAMRYNLSHEDEQEKRIVIPLGQSFRFLKSGEIMLIKSDGSYSEIFLLNGEKLTVSKNLKSFGELLVNMPSFFRCHRSYIVNLRFVREYVKGEGGKLTLTDGQEVSLSSDRFDEFLKAMQSI